MNFNEGANPAADVIFRMLMKNFRYKTKNHAYKWGVHVDLFRCVQNVLEIPHGLRILLSISRDWKERIEKLIGRHRAQEETAGFLGKTVVG